MKAGSLVSTNYPTLDFLLDSNKGGYKFVDCLPEPKEIYTCKNIYPHPDNPKYTVIEFEEFHVVPINGRPYAILNANFWHEVQPPMDLTELIKETENIPQHAGCM